MSRERWGTFSVADHLRPRAFVADVLLYDRLVVPYPPTAEERARWSERERQWRPDLLDAKLDLLPEEMVIIEQEISPADAVGEMEELLKQLEALTKKARIETYFKFTFMALPAAIGVATADAGIPMLAAGAAGLISVASFACFDRKPKIDAGDCDAAAMIHDVQEHFRQGSN
jgi:hypothetical protein